MMSELEFGPPTITKQWSGVELVAQSDPYIKENLVHSTTHTTQKNMMIDARTVGDETN